MTSQAFAREPSFYTTSNAAQTGYNSPDREGMLMVGGERRHIKRPQAAHQGDYDAPIRLRGEGVRWVSTVKGDGNVVFYVITCGAADTDHESEYARERKQKARALGWFPIASCPVALLKTGGLQPEHFVDQSLLAAVPCEHGTCSILRPCAHALAEQAARRAAHNKREHDRDAQFKDAGAKLIEAQQAQTTALVEAITGALAAATAKQSSSIDVATLVELLQSIKDDKPDTKRKG